MKFSKEEKQIIKVMVECENKGGNLALVLNFSRLLEKNGVGIVCAGGSKSVFLRKDLYPDYFPGRNSSPYVSMLFNLIEKLVKNNHLICRGSMMAKPLVIGAIDSDWKRSDVIVVYGEKGPDIVVLEGPFAGWFGSDRQEKYWMCDDWDDQLSRVERYLYSSYSVSEELKDLVKHNFKTEEQIRFAKQQLTTWVGIGVAILIGILGIIF